VKPTNKLEWILLFILALALTVGTCVNQEIHNQNDANIQALQRNIRILTVDNADLQREVKGLVRDNYNLTAEYDGLVDQIHILKEKLESKQDKVNRGGERKLTYLGEFTTTSYCPCEKCCGEYALNRPGGIVYGATGIKLQEGVSVAGWLPIGSRIMIEGREYVIQDRTAEWVRKLYNGKIIDIYVTDHKVAWNYGNPKKEVWLVE